MATFYIDYENVHNAGTAGIDELSNQEYVYLFYSQNANTMNMDTVRHFIDSCCGVEFIEADAGTPNALDFQLVTFLYSGIGQDDFHYIISKDHGFDAAIKMGNRMGVSNVKRYTTISEALRHYMKQQETMSPAEPDLQPAELVEEPTENLCDFSEDKHKKILKERIKTIVQYESKITLPKEELDLSYDGICTCSNKLSLYHYLRKQLGDKRGRAVYGALNDEFDQLKMDLAI